MKRAVVAGQGMVGHKLVETLVQRGATTDWEIVVVAEEPRLAYDRVALTSLFAGVSPADLALGDPGLFDSEGLAAHLDERVVAVDRLARTVETSAGRALAYDALILATGSVPFVPPVPGRDLPGCFVYRTIDDLDAIRAWAGGCRVGAVIGGGLLG